jgi:hypothetical protein
MRSTKAGFILIALLAVRPVAAACTSLAAAQLDFWVGDWNATWVEGGAKREGRNTIRRVLDGCVIREEFDGRPGGTLVGGSVSVYDEKAGQWRQTWVDNEGHYLVFTGGLRDGVVVLDRVQAPGSEVRQRMRFTDVTRDRFTWYWETSRDAGKTWETSWLIEYRRRAESPR